LRSWLALLAIRLGSPASLGSVPIEAVEEMAAMLKTVLASADRQQERSDVQQERIDLAARELGEVSARLQAAANALRESI
jgi:hypothetical protein